MKTRVLLFDLDDTLVPSSQAYDAAMIELGIPPKSDLFLQGRAAVKKRLGPGHPSARNRLHYFKDMLQLQGSYSPAKLIELMHGYENRVLAYLKKHWDLLNRQETFRALSSEFRLAIVTNESLRMQMLKLSAIDPKGEIFPFVMTSEEAGVEKPHSKIYKLVFEHLEVNPSECMMIGDSIEADIRPALELGMKCFWTREFLKGAPLCEESCGVLDKLADLPTILKNNV